MLTVTLLLCATPTTVRDDGAEESSCICTEQTKAALLHKRGAGAESPVVARKAL